jgi:energy-coupling factor transport system permease protein
VSVQALFVPRTSIMHRLDPRTKVALWIGIAAPAILTNSILLSLAMFLLIVVLAGVGRVSSIYLRNIARTILPVFTPIFLIQSLFYPGGRTPVFVILPWLYFRQEGIVFASILLTRLLAIFGGAYLLTLTTYPGDLMASMQKMGLPLKVAYPLFSAIQIVPVIESRLQTVKEAQMSRGLRLENVNLIRKLRNFIPLLTPLLLGAIEEAYRRSIALEARGFSSKAKKTFLREPRVRPLDIGFLAATLIVIASLSVVVLSFAPKPNPWSL